MHTSDGEFIWCIPDAYFPKDGDSRIPSHEAISVLNTGDKEANLKISFFFEDGRPAIKNVAVHISPESCVHLRLDKPEQIGNIVIPYDTAYGIRIESDVRVVVQYSRANTGSVRMALMTTIAYCNPTIQSESN